MCCKNAKLDFSMHEKLVCRMWTIGHFTTSAFRNNFFVENNLLWNQSYFFHLHCVKTNIPLKIFISDVCKRSKRYEREFSLFFRHQAAFLEIKQIDNCDWMHNKVRQQNRAKAKTCSCCNKLDFFQYFEQKKGTTVRDEGNSRELKKVKCTFNYECCRFCFLKEGREEMDQMPEIKWVGNAVPSWWIVPEVDLASGSTSLQEVDQ